MNTTTESAPDTRHDYEIAAEELQTLFASLNLTTTITGAHAAIDEDGGSKDRSTTSKGWPHVAVIVTFNRTKTADRPAYSTAFPWKMGVGLVDWKSILARIPACQPAAKGEVESMMAYGSRLTVKAQRTIAEKHLPAFIATVKPGEVLACVCAEGLDAEGQGFEGWAENLGYDSDSRKAEGIYRTCQEHGAKVRKLLSHAPGAVEKLAELANRL